MAILGNRVSASLKVFVVAFAVIDDLGAIIVIALFYTAKVSIGYLASALAVWAVLVAVNKLLKVQSLIPYIIGGIFMWFLMLKSGIHATVAGVLLAFAIPFVSKDIRQHSPSHRLEHLIHKPVAYLILPIFALANTGVIFSGDWMNGLTSFSGLGIAAGLTIGKPVGVLLMCFLAVLLDLCQLPSDLKWAHIAGAGILGGIGFTMSIFITNLAFVGNPEMINASKIAILIVSLTAGVIGFLWLKGVGKVTRTA